VRTQEVAPAELGASAGRRDAGLPEDLGDRCCRDAHADTGEFTDDPLVAPARVLAREPQHELTNLLRDRGSTGPPSRRRPSPPHKLAMPPQQRVRTDEERPARPPQQLAGRSKEDAVTLIQPRTGDLAAQHSQFVAEQHDLELLELARAQTQRRHRKRTPEQHVQQRHHHEAASPHPGPRRPTLGAATSSERFELPDGFTHPTRIRHSRPSFERGTKINLRPQLCASVL